MPLFPVTPKAMRPASPARECFYCKAPVGGYHRDGCVLIRKKVTVRMIVEYEVDVPAKWEGKDFEFNRNECSWCADNMIAELREVQKAKGCLCDAVTAKYVGNEGDPFLKE